MSTTEHHFKEISELCMSKHYSDVVFIIENERIPAHKCILAAKDHFFKSLLFGGWSEYNQKEIELKEPLEAFKALLRYIYSGQIYLFEMNEEDILDTLVLSNMHILTTLQITIVEHLKEKVNLNNVRAIFNVAWNCDLEVLKEACYTLMDWNASKLLAHESFNSFSKELLQDILCRDSFLAPEFEVLKAVNGWCKHNPDVDAGTIVPYVRLSLLNDDEFLEAKKFEIVNDEKLMVAMEARRASKKLPYRAWPEKNMAALKYFSKIIQGEWRTNFPPCLISQYDLEGSTPAAFQSPINEGIIVELGIRSIINHIKILLWELDGPYSYFVQVSANRCQWETVADYRECKCRLWQSLYFSPKSVKYIKLVGTRKMGLIVVALEAMYTEIVHKYNIAIAEICGKTNDKPEAEHFGNTDDSDNSSETDNNSSETVDNSSETDDN